VLNAEQDNPYKAVSSGEAPVQAQKEIYFKLRTALETNK